VLSFLLQRYSLTIFFTHKPHNNLLKSHTELFQLENSVESTLLSLLVLIAGIGASNAYIQFNNEISIFTAVLMFLSAISIAITGYPLLFYAVLLVLHNPLSSLSIRGKEE
jgi:hypothetical protein